jgi:Protein of unknown function (DUF3180)
MRPVRTTRPALLAVLLLLGGALGWTGVAVMLATGTSVGRVSWSAAGGLAFFAALLLAGAWYMYDRVHRRRRLVDGQTAVRLLALAKASALVGALVAGVYIGFALRFAPDYAASSDARDKVIRGVVTAVAAIVVVVGALLLERACKVPKGPDDSELPDRPPGTGGARGQSR